MPFRFVHTADIHLDSPLRSLALRDPALAELIGGSTRLAFERTIDLCLDEQVDSLMIAGDLYDGDQTSMKTALFLAAQLRRLDEVGIRVFIVRGNHDAESRITKELVLPEGVKVFGERSETVELERPRGETPVVVHGISFAKPQVPQNLVSKFKARVEGAFNVGLLHTSLAGFHAARRLRAMQRLPTVRHRIRLLVPRPYTQEDGSQPQPVHRHARHAAGARHQRGRPQIGDDGHRWERWLG